MSQINLAEILRNSFAEYYPAPIEAWSEFAGWCEIIEVKRNVVLKKENTAEEYFYFIIRGSLGLFLWKENNFVCLDFAFENQFGADYMSILTGQKTPLEVHALEDCLLARMRAEQFRKLGETQIGSILMRVSAETSFIDKQTQQIDLLTKTSKQRLLELVGRFPDIELRVAQKHIASYLGITPQSLSRIRGQRI